MDEYQLEIQSIRSTLEKLRIDEAEPDVIEEYAAELRNLMALHEAAAVVFAAGDEDPDLARALDMVGYGEWNFVNVYAFVYDAALAEDLNGRELSEIVNATDYAASLLAALDD